jgi:hypothetical protein
MTTFKINEHIEIEAKVWDSRLNWGHKGTVFVDGEPLVTRRITYYNRTWESYQFASLLSHLADSKKLPKDVRDTIVEYLKVRG